MSLAIRQWCSPPRRSGSSLYDVSTITQPSAFHLNLHRAFFFFFFRFGSQLFIFIFKIIENYFTFSDCLWECSWCSDKGDHNLMFLFPNCHDYYSGVKIFSLWVWCENKACRVKHTGSEMTHGPSPQKLRERAQCPTVNPFLTLL